MLSGALRPSIILGFLTLGSGWNPALLILMCTVVAGDFLTFYMISGKPQPTHETDYTLLDLDQEDLEEVKPLENQKPSLLGPCLFGAGWGLSGLCPGTVLAGGLFAYSKVLLWVLGCMAGAWTPEAALWLRQRV